MNCLIWSFTPQMAQQVGACRTGDAVIRAFRGSTHGAFNGFVSLFFKCALASRCGRSSAHNLLIGEGGEHLNLFCYKVSRGVRRSSFVGEILA